MAYGQELHENTHKKSSGDLFNLPGSKKLWKENFKKRFQSPLIFKLLCCLLVIDVQVIVNVLSPGIIIQILLTGLHVHFFEYPLEEYVYL